MEEALKQLNELKLFVSDKDHILGSLSTKHGEIAEVCQVNISNARNIVVGLDAEYSFENVKRTGPFDYLKRGEFVQSKFYNGEKGTLNAIKQHYMMYKDLIDDNWSYEIPSDQFDRIDHVMKIYHSGNRSSLSKSDMSLVKKVLKIEEETGINFEKDIHKSILKYEDVQVETVDEAIDREQENIYNLDKEQRKGIYKTNKPQIRDTVDIAVKSALIEGGVSFVLAYVKKRKEGKTINQFSLEDWEDLGIEFGKGSVKGGVRGATVFLLSNNTARSTCLNFDSSTIISP